MPAFRRWSYWSVGLGLRLEDSDSAAWERSLDAGPSSSTFVVLTTASDFLPTTGAALGISLIVSA